MEALAEHLLWPQRAACLESDPTMFFPGPDESSIPALQLCARCAVKDRCLQYALTVGETYGIWGGMTASGRRRLHRQGV